MKGSMLLKISTHPPQCLKLLVLSAVSVRERLEEDLMLRSNNYIHGVSLNKFYK